MARSKAFMNLYLRFSLSARSHRRRHLSRLPPLPGTNAPVDVSLRARVGGGETGGVGGNAMGCSQASR
jgi:hypothetical protein